MSFVGTPAELELLKQAIDTYCTDCGITDSEERLYVTELAISLYQLGVISQYDLRRDLEEALGPCEADFSM